MEIIVKHEKELVFELKGRLDTITSKELEEKFNQTEVKEDVLVLDFKNLEYISSAGLRVLLALKKKLEESNKALEVHNINDVVKEVFNVTGFINILTIK